MKMGQEPVTNKILQDSFATAWGKDRIVENPFRIIGFKVYLHMMPSPHPVRTPSKADFVTFPPYIFPKHLIP